MPSTTCGKEEPLATREAGDWLPEKPLCLKRTRGSNLSMSQKRTLAAETASSNPQEPRQNLRHTAYPLLDVV